MPKDVDIYSKSIIFCSYYRVFFFIICLITHLAMSYDCFANIYLKLEIPLHSKYNKTFEENRNNQDKDKLNNIHNYSLGAGYKISDYFETEIMFNQFNRTFKKDDLVYNISSHNIPDTQEFGIISMLKNRPPYCNASIEGGTITKKEICEIQSHIPSINRSYISTNIKSIIPLFKIYPLAKKNLKFNPYFLFGIGITENKYKINNLNIIKSIPTSSSKSLKKYKLAAECGAGLKIDIIKRISIEISVKYFNYGQHKFDKDIIIKANGYRFSTALVVGL